MAVAVSRYVDALYNSTTNTLERNEIAENLREFTKIYNSNQELKRVLNDPRLENKVKIEIVNEILLNSNKIFINFIDLIIKEKRVNLIEEMLFEYEDKISALKKELMIKIIVSEEIDDNQIGKIIEKFKNLYKVNTIKYSIEIDEKILGGIKVLVGNTIYDASIKTKLDQIF